MTSAKIRYNLDVDDASHALIDWFMSQTITPETSIDVMIVVIATILTEIEDTREEIQEKVDKVHEILTKYVDRIERVERKKNLWRKP
jgi:vacuolar-type H+-ATPase subunit I/STV1